MILMSGSRDVGAFPVNIRSAVSYHSTINVYIRIFKTAKLLAYLHNTTCILLSGNEIIFHGMQNNNKHNQFSTAVRKNVITKVF